jgi:hypothetical protein
MDFDLKDLSVFIGIPVNRDFPWQTTRSLIATAQLLSSRGIPSTFQFLTQGSQIDHDRSQLANEFLKTTHNRLFWIDSDMSWDAKDFLRLLALSTVHKVVGCSYPAKKEPSLEFHIDVATLHLKADKTGCLNVNGMGLGFTVVHREVIETLAKTAKCFDSYGKAVPMIFRTGIDEDGVYRSEDMHFFNACTKAGYEVKLDPTVELGHIGGKEYRGRLIDALQREDTVVGESGNGRTASRTRNGSPASTDGIGAAA